MKAVTLRQGVTPRYLQIPAEQEAPIFTTLVMAHRLVLTCCLPGENAYLQVQLSAALWHGLRRTRVSSSVEIFKSIRTVAPVWRARGLSV